MNAIWIKRMIKKGILYIILNVPKIGKMVHLYRFVVLPKSNNKFVSKSCILPESTVGLDNQTILPRYVIEYDDVVIVPETDTLIKNNFLLSDRFQYDTNAVVSIGSPVISYNQDKVLLRIGNSIDLHGKYINMCYDGEKNIWHLVFDMLSKFMLLNMLEELDTYPIVMDERIKTFCFAQEYINRLNTKKHNIVYLQSNCVYHVDTAVEISAAYLFVRGKVREQDKFLVSTHFIPYFNDAVRIKLIDSNIRKFYIMRGDNRLINENEIISLLLELNFDIIKPENYPFYEELGLFAYADCIVGSIGAAFANVIYAKSNARIICVGPSERIGLSDSYKTICDSIGANFYHINAELVSNAEAGTPGMRFMINCDEMKQVLSRLSIV